MFSREPPNSLMIRQAPQGTALPLQSRVHHALENNLGELNYQFFELLILQSKQIQFRGL
jgi:hypothetical protein